MHSTEECEGAHVSAEKEMNLKEPLERTVEMDLNGIEKEVQCDEEIQLGANENEDIGEQDLEGSGVTGDGNENDWPAPEWLPEGFGHSRHEKKRPSGAQKLKQRIKEALESGGKVLSRAERKRKPSDEKNKTPKKQKTVTGKEKTSLNSAAVPSANNPSVAQKHKAGTVGRGEMESSMKMAVVLVGYPENKMTEGQAEVLETCLIEKINPASSIQFSATQYKSGAIIFTCDNKKTKKWLRKIIPTLVPWQGAKLEVGPPEFKLQGRELVFHLTNMMKKRNNKKVLELLQKQNREISTAKWKILSRVDEDYRRKQLIVWVDDKSFETVKAHGFKLFLGLGRAVFKLLSEVETHHEIPDSQQSPKPIPELKSLLDIKCMLPKRLRSLPRTTINILPRPQRLDPSFSAVHQLQPCSVRLPNHRNPSENRFVSQKEARSNEPRFKAPDPPHQHESLTADSVPSHTRETSYGNSDTLLSRECRLLDSDIWERRYSVVDGQTENIRHREDTNAPQPHEERYPDLSGNVLMYAAPDEPQSRGTLYPVPVHHPSCDMKSPASDLPLPLGTRYRELNKLQSRDMRYSAPDQRMSRDMPVPEPEQRLSHDMPFPELEQRLSLDMPFLDPDHRPSRDEPFPEPDHRLSRVMQFPEPDHRLSRDMPFPEADQSLARDMPFPKPDQHLFSDMSFLEAAQHSSREMPLSDLDQHASRDSLYVPPDNRPTRDSRYTQPDKRPMRDSLYPETAQRPSHDSRYPARKESPPLDSRNLVRDERLPRDSRNPVQDDRAPRDNWNLARNERPPHGSRNPVRDERPFHDSRIAARDERPPRDSHIPARDERPPRDSQIPVRDERPSRDTRIPPRDERPPCESYIPARNERPYRDSRNPARDERTPRDSLNPVRDERLPRDTQRLARDEHHPRDIRYPAQDDRPSHDNRFLARDEHPSRDNQFPMADQHASRDIQYPMPEQHISRDTRTPSSAQRLFRDIQYPSPDKRVSHEPRTNIPDVFRSQEPMFSDSGFPLACEPRSGPSYISPSRESRNTFSNSSRPRDDRSTGSNLFQRRELSPSYTSLFQSRGSRSTDWNRPSDSRYSRP